MKKGLLAGLLLGSLTLAMVGCSDEETVQAEKPNRFEGSVAVDYIEVITDSKTSCKYIYASKDMMNSSGFSIAPLLKADGTVDCD